MLIDSHAHVSLKWFEPVETLLFQMDRHSVERAVLVQMGQEYDNQYLLDCVARHAGRFSAVVEIDQTSPNALNDLGHLAELGASGVRMKAAARSAGHDPFELWRSAERNGLSISCIGSSDDFTSPDFKSLLSEVPDLIIVLEHLGEMRRKSVELTVDRADEVFRAILPYPNVLLKVHGLGEGAERLRPMGASAFSADAADKVIRAYEVLGANRLMWGSDFPPSSGREGYSNTLNGVRDALRTSQMSQQDEDLIFGDVARRVFFHG